MPRANAWDHFAKDYHQSVSDSGDIYHKTYLNPLMLKLLAPLKGKKILDLACGNGYFSKILAHKGAKVVGADYSKELISLAQEHASKNLNFVVASSSNLSFAKDNSFDAIVSNVAFHDINAIPKTIKECSRVLKARKKLIFSIPHPVFHLSKRAKEGRSYFKKIESYLSTKSVDHPHYQGVMHYHRPIEYYLKVLFKNNFTVTGFHEIATKHRKGKVIKEKTLLKHKLEIPTFLVIEATLKA